MKFEVCGRKRNCAHLRARVCLPHLWRRLRHQVKVLCQIGSLLLRPYNPAHWKRDHRDPFEVYRLENVKYVRQVGEPVWMPEEIGLGIGREQGTLEGTGQEWLAWYTEAGQPYPLPEASMTLLRKPDFSR